MLWVFTATAGAVIGAIIGWLCWDGYYYRGSEKWKNVLRHIRWSVVLCLLGIFLGSFLGLIGTEAGRAIYLSNGGKVTTAPTDYELASLQDNSSVQGQLHGSFLIMTGSVNGTLMFNYYIKSGNVLTPCSLDSSKAMVLQDSQKPYLRYWGVTGLENGTANYLFGAGNTEVQTPYEFHLPPGSVVPTITLDAK